MLEDLPNRSLVDIKRFIDLYSLKGKNYCTHGRRRKERVGRLLSNQVQVDQSGKPLGEEDQDGDDSPSNLEQWFKLSHKSIRPDCCRDDYSQQFVDAFRQFASRADMNKFSHVYNYIADCLDGKYPRELNTDDSILIVSLLQDLRDFIEVHGFEDVKNYLSGAHQQETADGAANFSAGKSDCLSLKATSSSQSSYDDLASPDDDDLSKARALMNKYLEECKSLPKIRKIYECLNPLKVPVTLLESQGEKMKSLEDDFSVIRSEQD